MNPESIVTVTGGARFGENFWLSVNVTAPLCKLQIAPDKLVLSASFFGLYRWTFDFPREAIRRLSWQRGVFSYGIRIEHAIAAYPEYMLFWPIGWDFEKNLKSLGYVVEDRKLAP